LVLAPNLDLDLDLALALALALNLALVLNLVLRRSAPPALNLSPQPGLRASCALRAR
ncbi:MAG: hypothetical protein RLZZ275_14, partial [Bacteroidota bacterium]